MNEPTSPVAVDHSPEDKTPLAAANAGDEEIAAIPDLTHLDPKKAANEGRDIPIKLDGELIGTIRARGKRSDIFEKMQRAEVRRQQNESRKTRQLVYVDPNDQEEQKIALCVACTISWDARIKKAFGLPDFNPQAATDFYKLHKWVMEQVDEGIGDEARFLRP